ncbi:uncharacterized protein [Musca autumnalis]|uniref:uncharacterized protein n=1 Tax=Musca autumnalis TaxID=221902 RepID=UPI003CED6B00
MEKKNSTAFPIHSIQNLCRTCAKEIIVDESMNIFERLSESPEFPTVVKVLRTIEPQIKISFQDHLPKMVCITCIKRLRKMYMFLESYKQANYKLLKWSENIIDKSDTSSSDDEVQTNVGEFPINEEQESTFQGDNKLNVNNGENNTEQRTGIERTNDEISNDLDISIDDLMENSYDNNDISEAKVDAPIDKNDEVNDLKDTHEEGGNSNNDIRSDNLLQTITTVDGSKSKDTDNKQNELDVVQNKNPKNKSKLTEPKQKKKPGRKKRDYVCETCGQVYTKSRQYKNHLLKHKVDRPFLCSECGKGFKASRNLLAHMVLHRGEKKISCPICPKKFVCHSGLYCHMKIHNKVRAHVCETCGASFYRATLLRHHKLYHTGEKPYPCEDCDLSFTNASKLKCHKRTHTGEQPYSCYYCDRKFSQSGSCVTHMKTHVGVNVHQCELCPIRLPRVRDLREHIIEHKDEDEETRRKNLEARAAEINNLRANYGLKRELRNYTKVLE